MKMVTITIGIQINDTEVLKVDSAAEDDAVKKMQYWAERVPLSRNV
jgi:hypothetical protein